VKRFGKYRRKLWNDMESVDEMWNVMENMEENSEKIWTLWKKSKLNMEIEPMRWQNPVSRAAAAAIALKFHPRHVTPKNKTKHILKIPHINIIYDKTTTSQQNSD
jgi:hypothetical protein